MTETEFLYLSVVLAGFALFAGSLAVATVMERAGKRRHARIHRR